MRLFHAHFSTTYINDILDSGTSTEDVTVLKTRGYEMLDPYDRSAFMDVLIALFRKFDKREIRTGLAWAGFPGNPVMRVLLLYFHFSNLDLGMGDSRYCCIKFSRNRHHVGEEEVK